MLKIEDLKVGDKLECIDRDGYADYCRNEERCTPIDTENLIYSKFYNPSTYAVTNNGNIYQDAFKFFKKKEQSQYTFDDLIDVVVQANKDRVINGFSVVGGVLNCQTLDGEDYNLGVGCEVAHGIKFIQSLYKETFVIETEEDIQKIKAHRKSDLPLLDEQMSKAILENGNEILIFRVDSESPHVCRYMRNGLYMNYLDIEVLKCATVEQSKC